MRESGAQALTSLLRVLDDRGFAGDLLQQIALDLFQRGCLPQGRSVDAVGKGPADISVVDQIDRQYRLADAAPSLHAEA